MLLFFQDISRALSTFFVSLSLRLYYPRKLDCVNTCYVVSFNDSSRTLWNKMAISKSKGLSFLPSQSNLLPKDFMT